MNGNQTFTFIGQGPFTGAGQVRYYHQNGDTIIEADTNTTISGAEPVIIVLDGLISLRARRLHPLANDTRANHEETTMNAPTDFNALKSRQQTAWASGDYAVIGTTLQIVGEQLAEACDLRWDERVLDVAAGNGNATLAAARRGCRVTSTDYVAAPARPRRRAGARRAPGGRVPGGRRRGAAVRRTRASTPCCRPSA